MSKKYFNLPNDHFCEVIKGEVPLIRIFKTAGGFANDSSIVSETFLTLNDLAAFLEHVEDQVRESSVALVRATPDTLSAAPSAVEFLPAAETILATPVHADTYSDQITIGSGEDTAPATITVTIPNGASIDSIPAAPELDAEQVTETAETSADAAEAALSEQG